MDDQQSEVCISINTENIINVTIAKQGARQFRVFQKNQKPINFKTETSETANEWVMALRSLSFNKSPVSIDSFKLIAVIGHGYYGKITLARKIDTGELLAIKTVHKKRLVEFDRIHTAIEERKVLTECKHPFIISLHYSFQNSSKFYFCLEFAPGGELFKYMRDKGTLELKEVVFYTAEIALALNYLHSLGII